MTTYVTRRAGGALRRLGLIAAALFGAATAGAPAARAFEIPEAGLTVALTPTIASDYLFRGISQTRNNWAYGGTADIAHTSGVYVGAFISNAKFLASPFNDTRQELDLLAGYRTTLGGLSLDAGFIAYLYPGQSKPEGTQLNEFYEIALKGSYTIDAFKLLGAVFYSPNYFGRSGDAVYIEGGVDVTLPFEITGSARLGYQWIDRNPRFGTPDYFTWSVAISRELLFGVTGAVGVYGTDIDKRDCAPVPGRADNGQRICDTRVLFTLSRAF